MFVGEGSENENRYTRTRRASHAQGSFPLSKRIQLQKMSGNFDSNKATCIRKPKKKLKTKQKLFEFVAFRGLCFQKGQRVSVARITRGYRSWFHFRPQILGIVFNTGPWSCQACARARGSIADHGPDLLTSAGKLATLNNEIHCPQR